VIGEGDRGPFSIQVDAREGLYSAMLLRLLTLFIVVPLIELVILIKVGQHIGALPTIAMVVGIGMFGAWLARREGLRALRRIQQDLAERRLPGDSAIDALLLLVAAVLMITPGLLTDAAGLLLLIPPVRGVVRKWLKWRYMKRITIVGFGIDALRRRAGQVKYGCIDVEARPVEGPGGE
jgi:UPF0716 protein FxsA